MTRLVAAVRDGRVADKAEIGRALALAAEIAEDRDDVARALDLMEQAVAAERQHGSGGEGFAMAHRARLKLRLGRTDEALAEFAELRPLLVSDARVVSALSAGLGESGHGALAQAWLTEAIETLLPRPDVADHAARIAQLEQGTDDDGELRLVLFALAYHRSELRFDLGTEFDEYDALAEVMHERIHDVLDETGEPCVFCDPAEGAAEHDDFEDLVGADDEVGGGTALLFWPQPEFDQIAARWPELATALGGTWDEHRAGIERGFAQLSERGRTGLVVLVGAVSELAALAEERGEQPQDLEVLKAYIETVSEAGREIRWAPGRNEECWCGSRRKYKKCCQPRVR